MPHVIVVVEDEKSIREMYAFKLEKEGFTVHVAENGEAGLKVIEEKEPALVLLDLRMPVMNGEEMLLQMRNTDWGQDIPVVALTNISRNEAPLGLRQLGVVDYIVKAMATPQQVVARVQKILHT